MKNSEIRPKAVKICVGRDKFDFNRFALFTFTAKIDDSATDSMKEDENTWTWIINLIREFLA